MIDELLSKLKASYLNKTALNKEWDALDCEVHTIMSKIDAETATIAELQESIRRLREE